MLKLAFLDWYHRTVLHKLLCDGRVDDENA